MPVFLNEKQNIRTQKLRKVSCTNSAAHSVLEHRKSTVPLRNRQGSGRPEETCYVNVLVLMAPE